PDLFQRSPQSSRSPLLAQSGPSANNSGTASLDVALFVLQCSVYASHHRGCDRLNRTRFLLLLDTVLFLALVQLIEPRFAGLAVHEWLGIAIVPLIVVHLIYAWRWIAATLARLGVKGAWRLRINFLLNMTLFIAFTVATFSGLMTSFVALPALGIAPGNYARW